MSKVGAEVVGYITAIKQGEQFDQLDNLIYIASLPVFKKTAS